MIITAKAETSAYFNVFSLVEISFIKIFCNSILTVCNTSGLWIYDSVLKHNSKVTSLFIPVFLKIAKVILNLSARIHIKPLIEGLQYPRR